MSDVPDDIDWGHVKMSQRFDSHPKDSNVSGIVRKVHAEVSYSAADLEPKWEPAGTQTFFLPIEESELESAVTIRQLAESLQRSQSPDLLNRLDNVCAELLGITQSLHSENRGLGMMTPDNVVCLPALDDHVVLVDHGFVFDGDHYEPPWIEHPPAAAGLWDRKIAKQQSLAIEIIEQDRGDDVRLLIRLFQGLLTNCWQKTVISGDLTARGGRYQTASTKLWKVLDDAYRGAGSAEALASLSNSLKNIPLSHHFNAPPPKPGETLRPTPWLLGKAMGAIVAMLLVAAVSAWYMKIWPFEESVAVVVTAPEEVIDPQDNAAPEEVVEPTSVTASEELSKIQKVFDTTSKDDLSLDDRLDSIVKATKTEFSEDASVRAKEVQLINDHSAEFLADWTKEVEDARRRFEQPVDNAEWKSGYSDLFKLLEKLDTYKTSPFNEHTPDVLKELNSCTGLMHDLGRYPGMPDQFLEISGQL